MTTATRQTTVLSCGCEVATEKSGVRRMVRRCEEAESLFAALREARDADREDRSRVGRKQRIDAFAAARDEYQLHWIPARNLNLRKSEGVAS